jgi:hypothetical protein
LVFDPNHKIGFFRFGLVWIIGSIGFFWSAYTPSNMYIDQIHKLFNESLNAVLTSQILQLFDFGLLSFSCLISTSEFSQLLDFDPPNSNCSILAP